MKTVEYKIVLQEGEKIGFFSDLHANDYNLSQLLNQRTDIIKWFCAGDFLDMFQKNHYNVPTLRKMRLYKISSVLGNHEEFIIKYRLKEFEQDPANIQYLLSIPFIINITLKNIKVIIVHSTLKSTNEYIPADSSDNRYLNEFSNLEHDIIIIGHTHQQMYKDLGEKKIINPGTLSIENNATYCTMDINGNFDFFSLNI